ncbi:hypothetical protein [Paenibacillus hexagrammi]|uniref:Uncharacterized protein n=1 Tax=Paenibacillus hexagrammi TaxID=2908839 RepID=A0ABY3SQR9_9BACL|nr:hypothetical protein [Paenibacillus sp. YPD9-1]UJF35496.1 hypothetical protein L0M14_10555 [Paenibacillus sp. YPD9-1]
MSKLADSLKKVLGQMDIPAGVNKKTVSSVLKKIGEVQAAVDSFNSSSIDVAQFRQFQAELAKWRLTDSNTSQIMAGVRQVNKLTGSKLVKEADVSKLLRKISTTQDQLLAAEPTSEVIAAQVAKLRELLSGAESMISARLDALNLNERAMIGLLQKLK